MATTCKIGEEITVDGTAVEYVIDETNVQLTRPTQDLAISTSANSGTIQFSVGETPPAAQKAVAASTNIIVEGVQNGFRNLWAKGSGSGQKFTIF